MRLETERLILRPWQTSDRAPFVEMSADSEVMRYFPKTLSAAEVDELIARLNKLIHEQGYGVFAVEHKMTRDFMGCVGLHSIDGEFYFSPATEIAWRLRKEYWGGGYAFEAAKACLKLGFETLKLEEIVAYTTWNNLPSQSLMQRLGMKYCESFMHPKLAIDHELCNHVLYGVKGLN